MQYSLLLTLAPLALASNDLVSRNLLAIRQGGDAFQPGVGGLVQNCPNPCGASECIIPSRGDTCCVEGYGCPGGSFCLTKGYCCPNGDDPATCATQFGITLPQGFKPGQTVGVSSAASATPSSTPSSTPASTPASTPSEVASASTPATSTASSSAATTATFTGNSTIPIATGTGTGKPVSPTGSTVPFTGGASSEQVALAGLIGAGIVGAVALML